MKRAALGLLVLLASASAPAWAEPAVKLLDAGRGEKHLLRLHPEVGSKQTVQMKLHQSSIVEVGGQKQSVDQQIAVSATLTVTAVGADGDVHYDFTYDKIDVVPAGATKEQLEQIREALKQFAGIRGKAVLTSRSVVKSFDFSGPSGGDPNLRQVITRMEALQHMTPALPEEAVGLDARWQVVDSFPAVGLMLTRTLTCRLVAFGGSTGELTVDMKQNTGPSPNVAVPGLPAGATAELRSSSGQGSGDLKFSLAHAMPDQASMRDSVTLSLRISQGGQSMDMSTTTTLSADVTSK